MVRGAPVSPVRRRVAVAQETPTERDAARDVVRKLDSLEKSLDLPALVAKLTGPNAARDQVVARAKELMDNELLAMADDITQASRDRLRGEAVGRRCSPTISRSTTSRSRWATPGLPTAFVARYTKTTGAPNLGVILEYDALRGTKGAFHGDQHSAQGPIGIAAAVAIAEYLDEDQDAGKRHRVRHAGRGDDAAEREDRDVRRARLRRRGHPRAQPFDERDDAGRRAGFGTCCMNIDGVKYTFSGAPAHQLTAWNGRNALDGGHPSVRQHRRDAQQHPARGAHPGRDHRRRRGAERRARPHGGRLLHPLSRRGVPRAGARRSSTTRRAPRRSRPARR